MAPRTPRKPTRADLADRPDVSVHLDKTRKLWRAEIRLRQDPHTGRCQVKKVSSKNKHTLYDKLSTVLEELDQGVNSPARYTVADCVAEFLQDQTADLAPTTRNKYTRLARTHITPYLGRYLLAELRVADVLAWLRGRKPHLSSRTLRLVLNLLERAIRYAQVQEMVARNVAELARLDQRGRRKGDKPGRPSKSMTLEQAVAVLKAAEGTRWYAYLVLSIVTGARTEEIRALRWEQIDTDDTVPTIHVWTSVRGDGDTKTRRSRRSLELSRIAVKAVTAHKAMQARERLAATELWQNNDLVFCTRHGTPLDHHNVLRDLRTVMRKVGLDQNEWTARELRHTFVPLLSDHGVNIEEISLLVGHNGTDTTERVYRHQLRPVLRSGARATDKILHDVG
ncbi:tyrosine-type recombinase/integrase [Nocardiopsis algeriensis]|uniref:Integrase n=1 Tax=Nocardiopsis algeriensis TaxID=1478215 RepID=A0A841IRP0_9ACTN|nr:integrase [Nocardiopsis algeriensis]